MTQGTVMEKRKQDKCHQSFRQILNLLDLTDTSLEGLCEKCSELPNHQRMITKAMDQILPKPVEGKHKDKTNRPDYLCIFYEHRDLPIYTGDIYCSTPQGFSPLSTDLQVDKKTCCAMTHGNNDIFTVNAYENSSYDESFQEKIHPMIRKIIGHKIRNCVGYHLHGETEGLIIGFNYPEDVTRYDGEVIKSLAITVSSLSILAQQITQIKEGFIYLIQSLSRASEANDTDTGNHIVRVNTYAKHLAMAMNQPEAFCNEIGLVAQMHDVGKIHTPARILRKPGPLSIEERQEMEQHTLQGEKILGKASKLSMARHIAGGHHENHDGSGYPRGLKGDEIPLEAQIVKLVDIYDVLRNERPYKSGFSHEKALHILLHGDDRINPVYFNPGMLDVFHREAGAFEEIYENLK